MRTFRSICFVALGVFAGNAWAADPAYDRIVDDVVARYHLPGVAVGVIEDGKVTYTRTVGEAEAGSGKPITSQSIFKIASNSKAMTASVLARLVDQGKLHWDDPVVKYLPDFRMHDPWVTEHMLVRDLLVHNSGLPEGGGDLMLWPEPNHFSREDIVHGLGYIKPAYGFRAGYAYDNLLYVVAGQVAAAAGARRTKHWSSARSSRRCTCRAAASARSIAMRRATWRSRTCAGKTGVTRSATTRMRCTSNRSPPRPPAASAAASTTCWRGWATGSRPPKRRSRGSPPNSASRCGSRARPCRCRRGASAGTTRTSMRTATASAWRMSTGSGPCRTRALCRACIR